MKFITIYLAENKIELFNSILGKEVVKVNDVPVSSKRSITGAEHRFKIQEEGKEIEYKLATGFGFYGVVFDLYKNGIPVVKSSKIGFWGFVLVIAALVLLIHLLREY